MTSIRGLIAGGLVTVGLIGAAAPAGAVPLLVGQSLIANGLKISVTSCTLKLAGMNQASCASGHLAIVDISTPGNGSSVKILGDGTGTNGTDIFNATGGQGLYDVSFSLSVTGIGAATVNSVTLAMAGSVTGGNSGDLSLVSAGEASNTTSPNFNLTTSLGGSLSATANFTSISSFNVSKDLSVKSQFATPGSTLRLSYVTQTFLPAPEPISVALLGVGLAGLVAVRARRRSPRA